MEKSASGIFSSPYYWRLVPSISETFSALVKNLRMKIPFLLITASGAIQKEQDQEIYHGKYLVLN